MKRYFHFQQQYPHIYKDLLPSTAKLALCHGLLYALPFRTNDGCRILVAEAGKRWKPKEVSPNELFKGLILNLFVAMTEPKTQVCYRIFFYILSHYMYIHTHIHIFIHTKNI